MVERVERRCNELVAERAPSGLAFHAGPRARLTIVLEACELAAEILSCNKYRCKRAKGLAARNRARTRGKGTKARTHDTPD
jgi:hypothetical protein